MYLHAHMPCATAAVQRTTYCIQLVRSNPEWRRTNQSPHECLTFSLCSHLKPAYAKAGAVFLFRICHCESYVKQIGAPLGEYCFPSPNTHWKPLNASQCGHNEDDAVLAQPSSNGSLVFFMNKGCCLETNLNLNQQGFLLWGGQATAKQELSMLRWKRAQPHQRIGSSAWKTLILKL